MTVNLLGVGLTLNIDTMHTSRAASSSEFSNLPADSIQAVLNMSGS